MTLSNASALHVSKLRGMDIPTRNKLKRQGITYAEQLLTAAGSQQARRDLAARSGIDEARLLHLVRRSDMARIKGIGAIFADMLEVVGVHQVSHLRARDPAELRAALAELNAAERLARRAPTLEEVGDWVRQARALPLVLES